MNKQPFQIERTAPLRIGDDIAKRIGKDMMRDVQTAIVFYCRPLRTNEKIAIYVNGKGPAVVSGDSPEERSKQARVDMRKERGESFVFDPNWWKRGEHGVPVPADWWTLGANSIRFVYSAAAPTGAQDFSTSWIDLLLRYRKKGE